MKARHVSATEFKAKCLAFLDEVQEQGATMTVAKRGKPVAKRTSTKGILADNCKIVGDIVNFHMDWGTPGEGEPSC